MFKNWTICTLTIPSRDIYLRRMLDSLEKERGHGLNIKISYNSPLDDGVKELSDRLLRDYEDTEIRFYDSQYYGIPEGRNRLLSLVQTPLVAFLDDDCTIEGEDVFFKLEETLKKTSLGLIGLKSFCRDSDEIFKPRPRIPQKKIGNILYANVEGLLGASYTQLLRDIRGFNERKRFRMEWMDLNTKFHRAGYPTGIDLEAGFLRH